MDQLLNIRTPEHIELRYKLAGIGNRFLAFALDSLILLSAVVVLWLGALAVLAFLPGVKNLQTIVLAAAVGLSFIIYYGYFLTFETIWNGQTPGKRKLHIRVIREDGRPITFFEALIRNLMRIVDSLPPFLYAVGSFSIFFSAKAKRLGDYVAGTVVIREYFEDMPDLSSPSPAETTRLSSAPAPADAAFDLSKLSEAEFELIGAFLRRRADLDITTRIRMARRLTNGLFPKLGIAAQTDSERFLEQLYDAYQERNRFLP